MLDNEDSLTEEIFMPKTASTFVKRREKLYGYDNYNG